MSEISFRWTHGLGDTALFAPALKMWIERGYEIRVHCSPDKACLFQAVGANVGALSDSVAHHGYHHPPRPGHPDLHDSWSGNKVAWNLAQHPLPSIGGYADLWPEYLRQRGTLADHLAPVGRAAVDEFLATVDHPLVLLHTRGDTSPGAKNFPPELEDETYREILGRTEATLLLLDFDGRVNRLASRRVRHLTDDFRRVSLPELWYLISRAACFVGVDSGPLHLATKWTTTSVLGVWFDHHPSHFAVPSDRGAHLATAGAGRRTWSAWNRARRHSFNVIEVGDRHDGGRIADAVAGLIDGKAGKKLVIDHILDKVRCRGSGEAYLDRDRTFRLVINHLRRKTEPRMLETGCIRAEDDWTAGFATYLFGMFLSDHGGHLDSVDLSPRNVAFARRWTSPFETHVAIHEADSVAWIKAYSGRPLDAVYLDSLDTDVEGHSEHCLAEAEAVLPHLAEDGIVLLDDTGWARGAWHGKGALAIPYLQGNGLHLIYSGHQTLLRRPGGTSWQLSSH